MNIFPNECKSEKINFSRNLNFAELRNWLQIQPRNKIYNMVFNEMLQSPKKSMVIPMLEYLKITSNNPAEKRLNENFQEMLLLNKSKQWKTDWPKRPKVQKLSYKIGDYCKLMKVNVKTSTK